MTDASLESFARTGLAALERRDRLRHMIEVDRRDAAHVETPAGKWMCAPRNTTRHFFRRSEQRLVTALKDWG